VTGPKTDPRPGDTAYAPDGNQHARVLARRGDVVDLGVGYRDPTRVAPSTVARGVRVLRDTSSAVVEGLPVEDWAACYHEHTRRDPTTDPRAGDRVDDYVVEGVDTEHVWVRGNRGTDSDQGRIPRDRWATWARE